MKIVVTVSFLVSVSAIAHAQPDLGPSASDTTDPRDRSSLSGNVGLGTPLGEVGLEYTQVVSRNVEIGFGAGVGGLVFTPPDGGVTTPQVAIMPRLRTRVGAVSFTLGAGLSGGPYVEYLGWGGDGGYMLTNALWANGEAGVQVSSRRGTFARFCLGGGAVLAHSAIRTDRGESVMYLADRWLPYVGLGFGHSL